MAFNGVLRVRQVRMGSVPGKELAMVSHKSEPISQPQPPNVVEYEAYVIDAVLSMSDLEKDYGRGNVAPWFNIKEWMPHKSCGKIKRPPSKRPFGLFHFGRSIRSQAAIVEADQLGWRPATHKEAVAFAKAYRGLQRKFWIVALGSLIKLDGRKGVCVLDGSRFYRTLHVGWYHNEWSADCRFLFVRK
jgi:hypothetical protein